MHSNRYEPARLRLDDDESERAEPDGPNHSDARDLELGRKC